MNLGEKSVSGLSGEGQKLAIKFQVTNVDRPLIAVSKLTAAGHGVSFEMEHGTITNGTMGAKTIFEKKHGVFILKIWVPRSGAAASPVSRNTGQ